jgi:hypothetical protein
MLYNNQLEERYTEIDVNITSNCFVPNESNFDY